MIFFVFEHFSEKVRSFEPPRRADSESGALKCVAQIFMRKFAIKTHSLPIAHEKSQNLLVQLMHLIFGT